MATVAALLPRPPGALLLATVLAVSGGGVARARYMGLLYLSDRLRVVGFWRSREVPLAAVERFELRAVTGERRVFVVLTDGSSLGVVALGFGGGGVFSTWTITWNGQRSHDILGQLQRHVNRLRGEQPPGPRTREVESWTRSVQPTAEAFASATLYRGPSRAAGSWISAMAIVAAVAFIAAPVVSLWLLPVPFLFLGLLLFALQRGGNNGLWLSREGVEVRGFRETRDFALADVAGFHRREDTRLSRVFVVLRDGQEVEVPTMSFGTADSPPATLLTWGDNESTEDATGRLNRHLAWLREKETARA